MIVAFLIFTIIAYIAAFFLEKVMNSLSLYYKTSVLLLFLGLSLFVFYDYFIGQKINRIVLNGLNSIGHDTYRILNDATHAIIFFAFISSILCFVSSIFEMKSKKQYANSTNTLLYITAIISISIFIFCSLFIVSGMGWTI